MRIAPEAATAQTEARLPARGASREPGGVMLAALFLAVLGAFVAAVVVWMLGGGLLLAAATYAGSGAVFTVAGAVVLAALSTARPHGRNSTAGVALAPAQPA